MLAKLNHILLTKHVPNVYDGDAMTMLDLISKMLGKTNEIVEVFNEFEKVMTDRMDELKACTDTDLELFEMEMRQQFKDFTDVVDLRLRSLDTTIESTFAEYVNSGKLKLVELYDEENEEMYLTLGGDN